MLRGVGRAQESGRLQALPAGFVKAAEGKQCTRREINLLYTDDTSFDLLRRTSRGRQPYHPACVGEWRECCC